jgi:hypothetical protein
MFYHFLEEFLCHANRFDIVHENTGTFNQMFMRELNDGPLRLCSFLRTCWRNSSNSWRIA